MKLKEKVAIITGSGRGIGKDIAVEMGKKSAKVMVNDIDEEACIEVVEEIKQNGGEAIYFKGNIANGEEADNLIETAVQHYGTVDILVNNAAVTKPSMIHKMTDEQWETVIDVGLKGAFNCIRAVSSIFRERGKKNPNAKSNGKIINVTSVAGLTGTVGQINYGAAKSGVIGLTMSTAREWGRYKIQSNAVAFGIVETRMTETIRGEKFADIYKNKIVLDRFSKTEDVIPGVLFLASNGSDYITGNVLNISGGYHIGV